MAANPVARTAVKEDPRSGLMMLDMPKLVKLNSSEIAGLQAQIDALHDKLRGPLASRRKKGDDQ